MGNVEVVCLALEVAVGFLIVHVVENALWHNLAALWCVENFCEVDSFRFVHGNELCMRCPMTHRMAQVKVASADDFSDGGLQFQCNHQGTRVLDHSTVESLYTKSSSLVLQPLSHLEGRCFSGLGIFSIAPALSLTVPFTLLYYKLWHMD